MTYTNISNPIPSFSYFTDLDMATYLSNQSQNADTYLWDFGYNSVTSIVENPFFSYPSYGNYTVELNASNSNCPNIPSVQHSNWYRGRMLRWKMLNFKMELQLIIRRLLKNKSEVRM